MRRLQKSKRVSWAPDVNLCKVRLFLSEESPSLVGLGAQDHLQAKALHSTGTSADDILPPGFEGGQPANSSQIKASEVPVIKWRCPPRVVLNVTWQVVAGEESKEVELQNHREMRVFEAVYPRPSAIPQNPIVNADIEDSQHNDSHVPQIPILPIEDEDAADTPPDLVGPHNVSMNLQSQLLASGCGIPSTIKTHGNETLAGGGVHVSEPDVVAAASAAFAALNKSNEHGSLIDQDLLIKILSSPKLIEKLVTDYGSASNAQSIPKPAGSFVPLSDPPPPPPAALSDPSHLHMNRTELPSVPSSLVATSSGSFYAQPNGVGPVPRPNVQVPATGVPASAAAASMAPPQMKDLNYYKNLIQQHGGERLETSQQFGSNRYSPQMGTNQELVNPKSRDSKPKIMKPCIYYNSSRGCRHGANCAYQHDASVQPKVSSSMPEAQSAKRMKMDREISS